MFPLYSPINMCCVFCLNNMTYCMNSHIYLYIYIYHIFSPHPFILLFSSFCPLSSWSLSLSVSPLPVLLSHCLSQAKVPVNMDVEAVPQGQEQQKRFMSNSNYSLTTLMARFVPSSVCMAPLHRVDSPLLCAFRHPLFNTVCFMCF